MFKFLKEKVVKVVKEELVHCETCKCLLNKKDAYIVKLIEGLYLSFNFYCLKCKPPYDRISLPIYSTDTPMRYYITRKIEVDENGKEIKKK